MNPHVRVGDAEREETVAALQRYVADGYLTVEDFSQRSAAAYRARTHRELAAVTEDLAPRAEPDRNRFSGRVDSRNESSLRMVVIGVVVGVAVAVGLIIAMMIVMMMGGMGSMGGMR
jgi:hypothetical protein